MYINIKVATKFAKDREKGEKKKMMKNKTKIFKLISFILVIAIAIGLTIYLIPVIKDLATPERTKNISRKNK